MIRLLVICIFLLQIKISNAQITHVKFNFNEASTTIDPMIYGQMLENVNDSMIYGGITELNGDVRNFLIPKLSELQIPVMRWPGGTVIHEYRWKYGVGPRNLRPTTETHAWKGIENYQFGTDEFLKWCRKLKPCLISI